MANKLLDIRLLENHYVDNVLNYSTKINELLREDHSTDMCIYGEDSYIIFHNFSKREIENVVGIGTLGYIKSNKIIWLEIVVGEDVVPELVYEVKDLIENCKGEYAVITTMSKSLEQYLPEMKRNYFSSFKSDSRAYYFLEDENIIQFDNTSGYYRYHLDVSSASVRNLMAFMDCFNSKGEVFQQNIRERLLYIFNPDAKTTLLELRDYYIDSIVIRSILYEDRRGSQLLTAFVTFDNISANSRAMSCNEKYDIFNKFYMLFLMGFLESSGKKYRKLEVILKFFDDEFSKDIEDFGEELDSMRYIGDGFFNFTIYNDQIESRNEVEGF